VSLQLKELWQHRELLYFFTWRDIKVKYKQTALGILWALLQPLALMLLFVFIFSHSSIAKSASTVSYPIFVLSGLVVWNLFYTAVSHASDSMIANAGIIRKIYFPRLIIPVSTIAAALVDFVIGLLLFLVIAIIFKQPIYWTAVLFFPAAIILCLLTAFGAGSLLGALNVKFRDFRYVLPFFLQFLFFSTQVIYPSSFIQSGNLKYLFALNPINAAIELFRQPLTPGPINTELIIIGTASALLIAIIGVMYFRKTEYYFADII
jgi:lipopolysaccharide transport system permease protein